MKPLTLGVNMQGSYIIITYQSYDRRIMPFNLETLKFIAKEMGIVDIEII